MQAIQATQVGIRCDVPVMPAADSQADKGIQNPLVACNDCDAVWRSAECTRCPRCARQVGVHWDATEEQTRWLLYAVSLLDEERIQRASECEAWEFGEILREHVPFFNETCRLTLQTAYEALLKQPPSLKVAFAMEFFERAFLAAPEDEMTWRCDEDAQEHDSDVDEWW